MPVSSGPKQSRSEQVVAICLSMAGLSTLAVVGRIIIGLTLVGRKLGADDWVIMVSQAFSIAFVVDVIIRTYAHFLLNGQKPRNHRTLTNQDIPSNYASHKLFTD